MCFEINDSATRPKNKKVYKVVKIQNDGSVVSPFEGFQWHQRKLVRLAADDCFRVVGQADSGIYVLLNREDAEAAVKGCPALTILELDVNPKHWLYTSTAYGAIARRDGQHRRGVSCPRAISATYRVVRVSARQRYLTWY